MSLFIILNWNPRALKESSLFKVVEVSLTWLWNCDGRSHKQKLSVLYHFNLLYVMRVFWSAIVCRNTSLYYKQNSRIYKKECNQIFDRALYLFRPKYISINCVQSGKLQWVLLKQCHRWRGKFHCILSRFEYGNEWTLCNYSRYRKLVM